MPHFYDPDQRRILKGHEGGGRWTADGDGQLITQPVFLRRSVPFDPRVATTLESALALFAALSQHNGPNQRAIAAFKARDYFGSEPGKMEGVGLLTREEVERICDKLGDVQRYTDDAMIKAQAKGPYFSAATFGTAVHKLVEHEVNSQHDPDLRAEVSFLKIADEVPKLQLAAEIAAHGKPQSIRIDVEEKTKHGDVCVYDIKTGARGLSGPRMNEIAWRVYERHGPRRIIVIEVRPSWMYGSN